MTTPQETLTLSERSLIKRFKHMGKKLLKVLPSVERLLELLDKLELELSTVEQAPKKAIRESIEPALQALASDEFLQHSNENVEISVISCISEITRITAPEVPYSDEQMKEIFKHIVAAFEKLSHLSGRGYLKALNILENVSTVRLCLLMLDLECDDLVVEMFQHFLRIIRPDHPSKAIQSIELVMTLMLNESEDISFDLLRPLLDGVTNENKAVSPLSWTLVEKVIRNCALKLKPYLVKAVQLSGRAQNEYAQIVGSICESASESAQLEHPNGSEETVVPPVENTVDVPKDADEQPHDAIQGEPDIAHERDVKIVDETKSTIANTGASTLDGEAIEKFGSKSKPNSEITKNSKTSDAKANSEITKNSKTSDAKANLETDNLESAGEAKSKMQLHTVPSKRGRKPNSLLNPEEGYDYSWISPVTKTGKSPPSRKARNSSSAVPPSDQPTLRNDKLHPKPKTVGEAPGSENKSENIAKPAQSRRIHNIGGNSPPKENPASPKENLLSKPEDTGEGREPLTSKSKTDAYADAVTPFTNNNTTDGSHTKRGWARKASSNGDVNPSSVSLLKEDHLNPLHETSLASPGDRLEKESQVNPVRKIKFSLKVDQKTSVGSALVASETEPKVSSGDGRKRKSARLSSGNETKRKSAKASSGDEAKSNSAKASFGDEAKQNSGKASSGGEAKPKSVKASSVDEAAAKLKSAKASSGNKGKRKSAAKTELENIEEGRSSSQTEVKKRRRRNATPYKGLTKSSAVKELVTESTSKTLSGVKDNIQAMLRKPVIVSREASESRDFGNSLVGSRIKVWWPIDQMFYEGVIDSYDTNTGRHKILYIDGDVEVLNLKRQRWEHLGGDDSSDEEEEGFALQKLAEASDMAEKIRETYEELAKDANIRSQSRGRSSSSFSKSESVESMDTSADDVSESADDQSDSADESADDHPRTATRQHSAGKLKTKRMKTASDIKRNKPKTDCLKKKKVALD